VALAKGDADRLEAALRAAEHPAARGSDKAAT
jgi:hypothetical protein